MAQYDVDLRDYWRILKKRKTVIVLITILVGLSSYGFAKFNEPVPEYMAKAAVKINHSTNLAGFLSGAYWYEAENTVTQAVLITSFPVLSKTAKILGRIPENISAKEIQTSTSALAKITRLKNMITAEQEKGTNILNISVVSMDAEEAASVANAIANAFREYNIQEKNRQTFDTKVFIEKQLQLTSKSLKKAEQTLRTFKENNKLSSLDQQTSESLSELMRIEGRYREVKLKKEIFLSQLNLLGKTEFDVDKIDGVFFPEETQNVFRELGSKLHNLKLKRKALLFDFTEKHPQVFEINSQISSVISLIKMELNALVTILEARETDFISRINKLKDENEAVPEQALHLSPGKRGLHPGSPLLAAQNQASGDTCTGVRTNRRGGDHLPGRCPDQPYQHTLQNSYRRYRPYYGVYYRHHLHLHR